MSSELMVEPAHTSVHQVAMATVAKATATTTATTVVEAMVSVAAADKT